MQGAEVLEKRWSNEVARCVQELVWHVALRVGNLRQRRQRGERTVGPVRQSLDGHHLVGMPGDSRLHGRFAGGRSPRRGPPARRRATTTAGAFPACRSGREAQVLPDQLAQPLRGAHQARMTEGITSPAPVPRSALPCHAPSR